MSVMPVHEDLYAVLGVARTASAVEIQAAYFRNVRRHPPEKDAEGFRRIQAAYDVLRNEKTRREYDETLRTDPEARVLFDQGRQLLEDGKSREALPVIKRALARQPDAPVIRDLLTQALAAEEQYEEAEKQAQRVLALDPENPTYLVRLGDILRVRDRDAQALPFYRKAVLLDRSNANNVVRLAYLLSYLKQTDEAVKLLEESINSDGKVDFDDFIYFDCLYTIYTQTERYTEIERTRTRIRAILPPDREQRSFVAWFYYKNAMQMADHGNFEAAVRSIEEAGAIDASLPDLAETMERFRSSRTLMDELQKLKDDKSLEPGFGLACLTLGYRYLLGHTDELAKLFDMATNLMGDELETQGCNLRQQVDLARRRYPALAKVLSEFFDKVREADIHVPKTYVRLECPSCGTRGRTERPTVENLIESGVNVFQARALLNERGERGVLELVTFTCQQCQTSFNGNSQRVAAPQPASGSGCFVVTASYGDENAYAVRVLRAYRDRTLAAHTLGRFLIRVYKSVGPVLARIIERSPVLRTFSRNVCERIARRVDRQKG